MLSLILSRLSCFFTLKVCIGVLLFSAPVYADLLQGLPADYPVSRSRVDSSVFPWRAIGQLNMAGRGTCTATLVAPEIIVTAAHCLWNRDTERWFPPEYIHFVAGFSQGDYQAHSLAKTLYINPEFNPDNKSQLQSAKTDWALIRLQQPVGNSLGFLPVDVSGDTQGQWLQAGYRFDRSYVLTVNRHCQLVKDQLSVSGVVGHFCDTTGGDSGGPLLRQVGESYYVAGIYIGRIQQSNMGLVIQPQYWYPKLQAIINQQD